MKIHHILPIMLLMSATVAAQTAPAEALRKSRQAQDAQRFGEAKADAEAAIAGYLNWNRPDSLGESYIMLWSSSSLAGLDYPGRIPILEKARQAFEQAGNKRRQADVLTDKAELYYLIDSAPVALHTGLEALQFYRAVEYPELQALYNLLASIYIALGDYNEGARYGLLCVHTAAATGDTSASMSAYYNHLGISEAYLNQWDEAEKYYRRGLQIALKYHDTASVRPLSTNLAKLFGKSNRYEQARRFFTGLLASYPGYFTGDSIGVAICLLDIYNGLRQFQQGEPYVRMLEKIIPQENVEIYIRSDAAIRVARYYMDQGKFDSAHYCLDYYTKLARNPALRQASTIVPYYNFRLDSLMGHYLTAINFYERYKTASDSNLAATRSRQLAQYSALYEADQKDRSIRSLKDQADVQANRLRQQVLLGRMTIGGIALLLVLMALLYYAYRVKQRSNRQLEAQRVMIDQKNHRLEKLVTEKEYLVAEIHHRVKNNLSLISSLLESQGAYLQNEALFEIKKSQHRVQAISLIHQKLYLDEKGTDIDMSVYLGEIIRDLRDSFVTNEDLRFHLDLDPIHLDVSQAVPIGLIVNEAVTNALKYAFPDSGPGRIEVALKRGLSGDYKLRIADNGVGLPEDYHAGQTKSLGMSLIEGLSRSMEADLRIKSCRGTTIEVVL